MSTISKDFAIETRKTVLKDDIVELLKNAVNQCVDCELKKENYSNFNFETLLQDVVTQTIKSVFGEAIDAQIASQIIQYISGKNVVFSLGLDEYGIYGSDIYNIIESVYNFTTNLASLQTQCNELKILSDEDYYSSVKKIGDDFLSLAESLASSIPLMGYYIENMITIVSNAYDRQYSYIINDYKYNCTQMAIMALKYDVEAAEIFLLTQDNLIFNNQELILFGLNGKSNTFMDIKSILRMLNFDNTDDIFNYLDSQYNLINTPDEIREFCVKALQKRGYNFDGMSINQIREMLKNDFKNDNIGENTISGSSIISNFNTALASGYSYIPDTSEPIGNDAMGSFGGASGGSGGVKKSADEADKSITTAENIVYDPLVIDLGKSGFELTGIEDGVHFDMDLNGFAEKTGWITGDDAFLALDLNGDGKINNSGELFGDRTLL